MIVILPSLKLAFNDGFFPNQIKDDEKKDLELRKHFADANTISLMNTMCARAFSLYDRRLEEGQMERDPIM